MSTQGFDFSSINPYIQQFMGYASQAAAHRLSQMPEEAGMRRGAYQQWLANQGHRRTMDEMQAREAAYGRDAANALGAYGIASQNAHASNARTASIGNTAYGGSSPGGVAGAGLASFSLPQPYTPPAYGPREPVTVNVDGGRGSGNEGLFNPNEKYQSGWYNEQAGGGGGSGGFVPSYWNTNTSGRR